MKTSTRFVASIMLLSGILFTGSALAEDGPMKIAVANPSRILQQMQETQAKNTALQQEQAGLAAENKKRIEDIEAAQDKLVKFSKKGTPDFNEQANKLLEMRVQLQVWGEMKKSELGRRHKEEIKALFEKIQATIAQIAQERKIDLVITDFSTDIPDDLDAVTPEQLHQMISQKNVLFTGKGVDISAEVTARLDAAYKKK
jgi:Skp family chaperone for outer membrane proteins